MDNVTTFEQLVTIYRDIQFIENSQLGRFEMKMVGGNQKPDSGIAHCGNQHSGPSISPYALSSWMRASWAAELIAPRSVFLSSGLPIRIFEILVLSFSITSS